MKVKRLILPLAIVLCPLAQASTIFTASGQFQSGATISGTITIDTVTGNALASDIILGAPDAGSYLFIQTEYSPAVGVTILQLSTVAAGDPQAILAFPVNDFIGYTGGTMCAVGGPCGGVSNWTDGTHFDSLASGTLTAQTPEPSTAWLLAAGLALVAVARLRG